MAKRKLGTEENAFKELTAQTYDLRSTIGKNVIALYKHFKDANNTTGISMLHVLAAIVRQKGISNFDGRIEIRVGPERSGPRLPVPIVKDGVRKVHERITDASPYSGKELVDGYPLSYTLYGRTGKVLVSAGYRAETRLKEDEGELIGPDQIDTLLTYVPLLTDPLLPSKLTLPPKHERQEQARKKRKTLEEILEKMPDDFAVYAAKRNVDLKAMATIDLLEAGPYLAEEKWSALLWALDPGKHHTILNWFKEKLRADDLPQDVKEAWIGLNATPHLTTEMDFLLLATYRLQAKPERRIGIAGMIGEELRWLARQSEQAQARQLYGRTVNLQQDHEPAKFYTADIPCQKMTIDKKLEDPFWNYADREGILRKYPLSTFRKKWNRIILDRAFGDKFQEYCKQLHKIYLADHESIAAAKGPEHANTLLGKNYSFVKEMLDLMSDKGSSELNWEKLIKNSPVHESERNFTKLFKIARAATLNHEISELQANNSVFTDKTVVYSVPQHGTISVLHERMTTADPSTIDEEDKELNGLLLDFDALRERLPSYKTLKELGADFVSKLETILEWKDHTYSLLPNKYFDVNNTYQELLGNARTENENAYVSPALLNTIDELANAIKQKEKQILDRRQQLALQGYDINKIIEDLRSVLGKTYVKPHKFGISFIEFHLPGEHLGEEQKINEIIEQLSSPKREPNEKYVKNIADALAQVKNLKEFTTRDVLLDEESNKLYSLAKPSYDLLGVCVAGTGQERQEAMQKVFEQIWLAWPIKNFGIDPELGYVMQDVPHDKVPRICQQVYEQNLKNKVECRIKLV